MKKVYVGDGVYITWDSPTTFWLTTEDGISTTNEIYFEADVWANLQRLVTEHAKD